MAKMQVRLEKLQESAKELRAGGRGPERKLASTRLRNFQQVLSRTYRRRVAMVPLNERYSLAFMRWGLGPNPGDPRRPKLYVLDGDEMCVQPVNSTAPPIQAAACEKCWDLLSILDEEERYEFMFEEE